MAGSHGLLRVGDPDVMAHFHLMHAAILGYRVWETQPLSDNQPSLPAGLDGSLRRAFELITTGLRREAREALLPICMTFAVWLGTSVDNDVADETHPAPL
jgi:hypothetical protein